MNVRLAKFIIFMNFLLIEGAQRGVLVR
jgi:hypothetical protein